jgi:hypothetical protein
MVPRLRDGHVSTVAALAASILAAPAIALAQQPASPTGVPSTRVTLDDLRRRQEIALEPTRTLQSVPAAASAYALPVPEVTLTATKDGTEATAVIGLSTPFWGFRTTFKSPIGKEADAEASPLTLAGLANQATVELAYIRTRVFRQSVRKKGKSIDDLRLAFCAERGVPDSKCSDQQFQGEEREAFLNYGIHRFPTIFTAQVQIGGKSFDFVEPGSTTKVTDQATSVAGGASYAWLFLASQSVVAIEIDAARDYAASRNTTLLCQPIATDVPGTERCDARTIGRPTPSRKLTSTIEYRKVFSRTEGDQSRPVVGLSVLGTVQAADGGETVWRIAAPVYFLQKKPDQNKSAGLNGGAEAGWDSKNGFTARVFVGAAFALIAKGFNQ